MRQARILVIAVIATVIGAIYGLDVVLARAERGEVHAEAQQLYDRGTKLLGASRPADALEPLQRAYTLDRASRPYQLAYAEALSRSGRLDEAATLLNNVLRSNPNDGKGNLLLARIARSRGDFPNEAAFYHRAIYGTWDRDAAAQTSAVRLEWVRELANRGERKLLLGELLPLEAETQDSVILQQVAHYLLVAGSPARSAELYGELIEKDRNSIELEKGLGEAEAAAGNYSAADRAYARALRMSNGDPSIEERMRLVNDLSNLDPTPRRLSSRAKYERSVAILRLVREAVVACGVNDPRVSEADTVLALKKPDTSNEAAEQLLTLAEALWREHPASCAAPAVIPLLMQKLADSQS